MGTLAVLFWSFSSSLVYLGAQEAGIWTFVALGSVTGGLFQLIMRRIAVGELRSALRLPWRLWAVPVPCFVAYGLALPCALALASPRQVFGVNLINYLWPVLTVIFSAFCVPGVRLTARTVLSMLLALAGLAAANLQPLRELLASAHNAGSSSGPRWLPFALALLAAVTWALYSSVLARWRQWAGDYVTSPLGFIMTGVTGAAVLFVHGHFTEELTVRGGLLTLLYGVGPLATGYLLWELALARARVQTLSFIAAATPILSTALLCCFLRTLPGPELVAAAALVSGGVILSRRY